MMSGRFRGLMEKREGWGEKGEQAAVRDLVIGEITKKVVSKLFFGGL